MAHIVLLALTALLTATAVAVHNVKLPVFATKLSLDDFIYSLDVTENLLELTCCMWLSMSSGPWLSVRSIVSYAVVGNTNAFLIDIHNSTNLRLMTAGKNTYVSYSAAQKLKMQGWQRHCFLWDNTQLFEWYTEWEAGFELIDSSTNVAISYIPGGGAIVLLQEQDSVLGSFDLSQIPMMKIAGFNMWNTKLSVAEMNDLGCWDQGNLVSMNDFVISGSPDKGVETFPCKDKDKRVLQDKSSRKHFKAMTFCKVDGKRLTKHIEANVTATSVQSCMQSCLESSTCFSINFLSTNNDCELNSITDLDDPLNFVAASGYLHFTHREC